MKFEAFYKEAYDAEMEELFSDNASETENKPSKDSCDLLMKKADLEFSQYKLVKSEKYYDYLLANLYHEMGLHDKTLQCARQVITQKPKKESKETQEMKAQMESLIKSIH